MEVGMKEIGMKTKLRVLVFICGLMVGDMKDTGKTIICMDKEYIHGEMEESMMEITIWIKNMVMVFIIGLTVENTRVSGQVADNMVKENTHS